MIQLTLVTTLFGAASAAAAIDAGLMGDADQRVLVVANNAPVPEAVRPLTETPGVEPVLSRFDRVVDLGDVINPQRPARWTVSTIDGPAYERLLRSYWGLGDEQVELVLESVHVPPAATLASVFASARITVLSEGLMSFGPTRNPQTHTFGQRLTSLVYLDLVEGLDPLLLSEHGVPQRALPPEHFRALINEICDAAALPRVASPAPTVLVLGQYLAALGLVTPAEETAMQVAMLDAARDLGAARVLFKPHPSAPATNAAELFDAAHAAGLEFEIAEASLSAEALMATHELVGVVASFSTALATARRVFGLPTRATGTTLMLAKLKPFQNSNRIPLTIVDHLHRHPDGDASIEELRRLTVAVAFAMQPETLAARRADAAAFLETAPVEVRKRYFTQGRINAVGLPGAVVPRRAVRVVNRTVERMPAGLAKPAQAVLRRARIAARGGKAQ